NFILPGFIDSHVHIESSMMIPENFGEIAMQNGTVAVVTDPHEIANVLGLQGVDFMMNSADKTDLKIFFGAPSCVPATGFETSGAALSAIDISKILNRKETVCLSEMMNFPGVIYNDKEVWEKLAVAKKLNLPIDGHAPGLTGENLKKYVAAGISTDHECSTKEEALEKIALGMKILIREGSAARNFEALYPLIKSHPESVMLCTDDSHPDELLEKGHINKIVKIGINKGVDVFKLLTAACINPIKHYNLPVGQLNKDDSADFIIVNNLSDFEILATYINGKKIKQKTNTSEKETITINNFHAQKISAADILVPSENESEKVRTINAFDGDLLTKISTETLNCNNGAILPDNENDILKMVVLNRYEKNIKPAVAFIKGFGIKDGAIASTIAHDSHNIIAVGSDDILITEAINRIIETRGGIVAVDKTGKTEILPLPIAGLLTTDAVEIVAGKYKALNRFVKEMGSDMRAPFMTLSFMALLVIPEIKLSDKGLFDGNKFEFINLFE
ncbi:MAG: adenine deaminase, partial [Bacteroidales bacterium]|nr:adenine deaminase [Bacteroidales bacterium]